MLIEHDPAFPDFSHLEGNIPSRCGNPEKFAERPVHDPAPFPKRARDRQVAFNPGSIDPVEPAPEPVVLGILNGIKEGGRCHGETDGSGGNGRRIAGIPGQKQALLPCSFQKTPLLQADSPDERTGLFENELPDIPVGRYLGSPPVDPFLPAGRDSLVWREGINREETAGMAGQPVGRHHADPCIEVVLLSRFLPVQEVRAQRDDLGLGVTVVEHGEIDISPGAGVQGNCEKPLPDLRFFGKKEPWTGQDPGKGIDIIGNHPPCQETCFKDGGAPPGKGITDPFPLTAQPKNEKPGQLRLEAGTIGYLMNRRGFPLPGGPELAGKTGNPDIAGFHPVPVSGSARNGKTGRTTVCIHVRLFPHTIWQGEVITEMAWSESVALYSRPSKSSPDA